MFDKVVSAFLDEILEFLRAVAVEREGVVSVVALCVPNGATLARVGAARAKALQTAGLSIDAQDGPAVATPSCHGVEAFVTTRLLRAAGNQLGVS